jgi:5-methylcytosine-specific restriction enzyme A
MPKLHMLPSLVRPVDVSTTRLPGKYKDPLYNTPEFRAWREQVMNRADYRCEAIERGLRCTNRWPEHRMIADHIVELKDGGQPFDIANGQCLCAMHHRTKTITARSRRFGR